MNKVYKVVWSKAKNCYVVASELAKSHTKSPKSGVMSRALVAGVLACVLSCGAVMPAYADFYDTIDYSQSNTYTADTFINHANNEVGNGTNLSITGDISSSGFSSNPISKPLIINSASPMGQGNPMNQGNLVDTPEFNTGKFVVSKSNTVVKTTTSGGYTFPEYRFTNLDTALRILANNLVVDGGHSNSNPTLYCANPAPAVAVIKVNGKYYISGMNYTYKRPVGTWYDSNGNCVRASGSIIIQLVQKDGYIETDTRFLSGVSPNGAVQDNNLLIDAYNRATATHTYASVGEELSIFGKYSPDISVTDNSSLNLTGSAALADGDLTVSNNSLASVSSNLSASKVSLSGGSTVTSGGTLSAKSIVDSGTGTNTLSAVSVQTTEGDINTPNTDVTATDAVESAGVVKLKSLNAPRLLGAGSGMSTLGGGLTVAGQVKGVADATDTYDAVNLGQLNTRIASVAKPYIGITGGELENAYGEGAVGSNSIAFGPGAYASDVSVSIGWKAGTTGGLTGDNGDWTVSIGAASNSTADGGVALGHAAIVKAESAVSIGENSTASASGAVAIGSSSVANTANTVSVGSSSLKRKIVNVANGTAANDAATYGQVSSAIKGLSVSGQTITYTKVDGTTGTITTQDANTTYSAGNGVSLSGTTFSAKPYNGITVDSNGIGVKAGTNVTVNSNGVSVTGSGTVASGNTGLISGGTLFTEGRITADGTFAKKANSIATNITALDTAAKNAIKGLSVSGTTITYTKGDGTTGTITTQDNNTTYSAFTGATSSAAGTAGLVKAPAAGDQNKFLRGDGTWAVDNDTKYSAATTSAAGLMSAADKAKLDGIASGANAYTLPAATSSALGGVKIGSNITNSNGTISLTKANVTAALGYTPPTQDTNTTYDNMSASELSTGTATTARSISAKTIADYVTGKVSAETTARSSAISSEATTRANADTALGTRIDGTIKDLSVSGRTITYTKGDGTTGTITTQDTNTTYAAGNGVALSGTTFSAKAGTNVSVDSNGINVVGNGSVASGNTGLVSGGTLFTENRITADGTFAKKANTTAANITALDTAAKNAIKALSVSGQTITYTKGDGTTGTITTQDNNTTYSAFTGATSSAAGTAGLVKAPAAGDQNKFLRGDGTWAVDNDTKYTAMTADEVMTGTATTARSITAKVLADYVGGKVTDAKNGTITDLSISGKTITYTKGDGTTGTLTTQDSNTTYSAGAGLSLSGTTFSVNTSGSIASGNTGVLNGGTVYSEVRPTADGTFAKKANTTAANITALDTAAKNAIKGLSVSGTTITYTKGDGTTGTITTQDNNTTYDNMTASELSTGTATVARSISAKVLGDYVTGKVSAETTARTTAINSEASTRQSEDDALSNRIGSLSADGNYIKKSATNNVSANLTALDTQLKTTITAVSTEATTRANADTALGTRIDNVTSAYQSADTTLGERIGTVSADGHYIKKSSTKDIAENLQILDEQLSTISSTASSNVNTLTEADAELSNRIGSLASDGNYIKKSSTNDVIANLSALDTQLKATDTAALKYDGSNHELATLGGTNGTKLTNLKQGTLSASSKDAVTGAQLYATNQSIAGFATDITRNKNNIRDLNDSVSSALDAVSSASTLVDTINGLKADASLNNLTAAGRQVIATAAANAVQEYIASNASLNMSMSPLSAGRGLSSSGTLNVTDAGNGSLHVGEGSYVNGTSSIAIGVGNQVNANNSGAFGDPSIINADESYVLGNDDTINEGATGSFLVGNDSVSDAKGGLSLGSNNKLESSAEDSVLIGNNTSASGRNSVALGSGSVAEQDDAISVGNSTLKRRIMNVADGDVSEGSTDVVTGGQLYVTNEKVKTNEEAIAKKAETDASNIDVEKWSEVLGTGEIAEGNTGLVNGGTVYEAMNGVANAVLNTSLVKTDGENIFVGSEMGGRVISVMNNEGESRVITGVATNPQDSSSAANVGYVNAVGELIANNISQSVGRVNNRIDKVGANAAALASLTPASFEGSEKWSIAASVGHFKGETAGAVGAFYKPAENVMMNVRGSFGNDESMLGAGVAIALDKGDVKGVTKRQLADAVNKQAKVIDTMKQEREEDRARIAQLEAAVQALLKEKNSDSSK